MSAGQLVARGVTVAIHREISSLDRLLPLVLADSAICITVASAAAAKPFTGVVYRYFTDPSPHADCSLVWWRDTTNPQSAHSLTSSANYATPEPSCRPNSSHDGCSACAHRSVAGPRPSQGDYPS
jgi:predicted secreted hydrolase